MYEYSDVDDTDTDYDESEDTVSGVDDSTEDTVDLAEDIAGSEDTPADAIDLDKIEVLEEDVWEPVYSEEGELNALELEDGDIFEEDTDTESSDIDRMLGIDTGGTQKELDEMIDKFLASLEISEDTEPEPPQKVEVKTR